MPSKLLQALPALLRSQERALLRQQPVQERALPPSWSKQSERQR